MNRGPGARRAAALVALVAAALAAPRAAPACPGDPPALAALRPEARAAFLRERIERARPAAVRWSWTWGIVDGALVAGQLAALPSVDRGERWVLLGGAASAALGVGQVLLAPVAASAPPAVGDACATVADLERALERGARNQALGSGVAAHLGNLAINAALGWGAWAADGWRAAAWTLAAGTALGEAQILTQPTSLARDWARYRAGDLSPSPASGPALRPGPGAGVSVVFQF